MSDMVAAGWRRKTAWPSGQHVFNRIRPILAFVGRHPLPIAGALLIALCCLAYAAVPVPAPLPPKPIALRPAPLQPVWLDIIKPIEIFSLEAADLSGAAKTYAAKRNRIGGGRRDTLGLGTLGGPDPALRLSLYRRGSEEYVRAPVFADVARVAAEAGLSIAHSGLPTAMTTRFGRFEVMNVSLASAATPGVTCDGFRLNVDKPTFTILGLACGAKKAPMTRERLSCLLDRLDLASAGEDRPLLEFFAASELRRNGACSGMRLGPDGLHAAWLDDRPATPAKIVRHH